MKKSLLLSIAFCGLYFLTGCGSSQSSPPPPSPDFSISISPLSVATVVGSTTAPVSVSVTLLNGFTGPVTVTVSGFPDGISSSPASPFVLSPGTPQQVTFSAAAAAGTFTVEFQGVSGTLSHSASETLTVTPQPNPYLVSASYYPWYIAGSWENQTLRDDLIPSELPALANTFPRTRMSSPSRSPGRPPPESMSGILNGLCRTTSRTKQFKTRS